MINPIKLAFCPFGMILIKLHPLPTLLLRLLLLLPLKHQVPHSLILIKERLKFLLPQLKKGLILLIEPNGNPPHIPIIPILLNLKDLKAIPILNHPYVIGLLSGLACTVDGVNAYVLVLLGLSGMDYYADVHVVGG
jgi:hypothetical protein